MKDFYLKTIAEKKQEHPDVFEAIVMDTFGWVLEWKDVEVLSSHEQIELMCEMEQRIKIKQSPLDIARLAVAIQHSRSGCGLCAITPFTCAFCGTEEEWGNSAVPKICKSCATKMATNMAKQGFLFLKNDYSVEPKKKDNPS